VKRTIILGVLIAAGALAITAAAYQQPPRILEAEKVADNLYFLHGPNFVNTSGGNTTVFIRTDGVTVIDTKNRGWGQPILNKIRQLTSKPVTLIINTHTHADHTSGNVEFPATVEIVAHENTAVNMPKMGRQSEIFTQGRGLPKRTFKDRMTIGRGVDQIDLYYFGRGHTNGDAWVLFPSVRVAIAADSFARKNLPFLDTAYGASAAEFPETLDKAYATLSKLADTFISGHVSRMTAADLREYAVFNREFLETMRAAKKAGKTVDEAVTAWKMPAKYPAYNTGVHAVDPAAQAGWLRTNARLVYEESP
jgi:cyclase